MTFRVLPYRVPPADAISASGWRLVLEDGEIPAPEAVSDWDYRMDLRLRRELTVDLDRTRNAAGLPADAALTLAVVWNSTGSNLSGHGRHVRLDGSGTRTVPVEMELRGADLGGILLLDTALVLAERRTDTRPSAPRRAGSVLWSDRTRLRLQGDAPQFPMAVIDFGLTSFPEHAAWHLQISGGLENATMGSLLLLVNERNKITTAAFRNAGKPREVDKVVLSAVYADAARVMVEYALSTEDFSEDADYSDDSLGATLLALFDHLFPDQSIEDLRRRRDSSPPVFASDLQAAVRIFEVSP